MNRSMRAMMMWTLETSRLSTACFLVVKRGFIKVHYYYIPVTRVQGWDGRVVWLKLPLEEVEQKYHIDKPPDPSIYYIKGYPYDKFSPFTTDYFPELAHNQKKAKCNTITMDAKNSIRINENLQVSPMRHQVQDRR